MSPVPQGLGSHDPGIYLGRKFDQNCSDPTASVKPPTLCGVPTGMTLLQFLAVMFGPVIVLSIVGSMIWLTNGAAPGEGQ